MKKEEPSNKGQEYCDVGKGSREVAVSENEGGRVWKRTSWNCVRNNAYGRGAFSFSAHVKDSIMGS